MKNLRTRITKNKHLHQQETQANHSHFRNNSVCSHMICSTKYLQGYFKINDLYDLFPKLLVLALCIKNILHISISVNNGKT